jgi:hypothetical protein
LLTVDEVLNTLLTIRQRVQERSTHANSFRTKAQSFDNVSAAPDSTVYIDFEMLEYFRMMLADLKKSEKRWR